MGFLKPFLGRNGHDEQSSGSAPTDATPAPHRTDPMIEARSRAQGILSAELEHLEDVYLDALRDVEQRFAKLQAEMQDMLELQRELERSNAENERKLRAVRELLAAQLSE
jgi:hypothetical protein